MDKYAESRDIQYTDWPERSSDWTTLRDAQEGAIEIH